MQRILIFLALTGALFGQQAVRFTGQPGAIPIKVVTSSSSPISGATTNCIVTAASATTIQTNTNCPTTDSSGNVSIGGTVASPSFYNGPVQAQFYWNPSSLLTQDCKTFIMPLAGARQGTDVVSVAPPPGRPAGFTANAYVVSPDIVTVEICNPTGSTVTFSATGIWTVLIPKGGVI